MKFCDFLDNFSLKKANSSKNSDLMSSNDYSDNNSNEINNYKRLNKITTISNDEHEPTNITPTLKANKIPNANNGYSRIHSNIDRNQDFSYIEKPFKDMENHYRFCIPIIISPEISTMKMREMVQLFRAELLIFDLEKRNGIVFNLPDIIQCSMFGICGIANDQSELLKIIENTVNLMKSRILHKDNNSVNKSVNALPELALDSFKTDSILFSDLLGRILHYVRNIKK